MRKTQTPAPSNDHETDAPKPRDRHGERSVPPPLAFDIDELPDSTLLTSHEVAAYTRNAVSTVETWRLRPGHGLRWIDLPGGYRRTTIGYLKKFLPTGKPRKRPGPKPRAAPTAPPPASPRQLKPRKPSQRRDRAAAPEAAP